MSKEAGGEGLELDFKGLGGQESMRGGGEAETNIGHAQKEGTEFIQGGHVVGREGWNHMMQGLGGSGRVGAEEGCKISGFIERGH